MNAKKFYQYSRWLGLNILLPLSPLGVKLLIVALGKDAVTSNLSVLELPEAFFYSISASAVTISISVDGDKKVMDYLIIFICLLVIGIDLLALGMVYSMNYGDAMKSYSKLAFYGPTILAIAYKFLYKASNKDKVNYNE